MNEFEAFFYYGLWMLNVIIGIALLSTFFVEISDVETWRTILFIVFIILTMYNVVIKKPVRKCKLRSKK